MLQQNASRIVMWVLLPIRKLEHLSGNARKRLQSTAAVKQSAVHDRMSAAREYIAYLGAGVAEGQVNSKISAQTSKADFIRTVLMSDEKRATADNNALSKVRNLFESWSKGMG